MECDRYAIPHFRGRVRRFFPCPLLFPRIRFAAFTQSLFLYGGFKRPALAVGHGQRIHLHDPAVQQRRLEWNWGNLVGVGSPGTHIIRKLYSEYTVNVNNRDWKRESILSRAREFLQCALGKGGPTNARAALSVSFPTHRKSCVKSKSWNS